MSTTEATPITVGTPVRFTAGRLGLLGDTSGNHFIDECVGEGDVGSYAGLHPSPELAAKDWHLIKVARAENGGTGITIFAPGHEAYAPVHRSHFEPDLDGYERTLKVTVELEIAVVSDGFPEAQLALVKTDLTDAEVIQSVRKAVEARIGWQGLCDTIAYDDSGNLPIYLGELREIFVDTIAEKGGDAA